MFTSLIVGIFVSFPGHRGGTVVVVETARFESCMRRSLHAHPHLSGRGVYACVRVCMFLLDQAR